ncbi:MucR family transcriptional regulator [Caulobacter endophyticus]|uniref:MucR family transcriptional regulator n=1 Tax=Caulobacter endophyticus TaxID=2172652 RepID=UPI0024106C88|nr:MucR family transcriptional regulator [Caulobacter endophyticus]MDG2528260.1 MucR family transcriptional regulator [Caulobacter endophyticus]
MELKAESQLALEFQRSMNNNTLKLLSDLQMKADDFDTVFLTAEIVAAYVGANTISIGEIPLLIRSVHGALSDAARPHSSVAEPVEPKPTAAQIRKSITPDALISFIDGKAYKTLKRHLTTHGLTVDQYRMRFGLPGDYPTTAASYSEMRSGLAKALGLGQPGKAAKRSAAKKP